MKERIVSLAMFYHLMMVIHMLLSCSHGNGSCSQHLQPLCAALALGAKRVREVPGPTHWQEVSGAPAPTVTAPASM